MGYAEVMVSEPESNLNFLGFHHSTIKVTLTTAMAALTFFPQFKLINFNIFLGCGKVGLVVKALAFHQCSPSSICALGVICGLSLLVLYSAMRDFSPGTPVFPSHQKPTFDLICE